MRRAAGLAAAVVLAALAAGCGGQAARLDNPVVLPGTQAEAVESVAIRVLRELRFEPIYPPASKGLVETHGLTGASWFEPWRGDTIGHDQRVEASLHTIRRRVALSVSPTESGSRLFVKVVKERLSAPGTGPSGIGGAYSLYRSEVGTMERPDPLAPGPGVWVEVGRDERLEQRILRHIHRQLGSAPSPKS